jgi:oligopeptide/dipeptide ABC transporter ATP-binding protein
VTDLLTVRGLAIDAADSRGGRMNLLRGVDLDIARGEIVAVVGESGCGKSLTAKALLGLLPTPPLRIAGGSAMFQGSDLLALDEAALHALRGSKLALVPQHPLSSLNPAFTLGQQFFDLIAFRGRARVGMGAYLRPRLSRAAKQAIRAEISEALRQVSLPAPEQLIDRYPHELSGGMSQRALIAMALLGNPELLIADEPSTALDVTIGDQINRLLVERVQAQRAAMLYITHDLGIARAIAGRVFVMYAGRVVESGKAEDVLRRPLHPYTKGLLRAVPRLVKRPIEGIAGTLPDPRAIGAGCAFRWRCPQAVAACAGGDPQPILAEAGHEAACIHVRAA